MIRFYEVAPEYRESPIESWEFGEGCVCGEITVTGNREYDKHETELYQLACSVHDDIMNYDYTVDEVKADFDIVDEAALKAAYDSTDMRMIICLLMKALSGREWENSEIHGSVQGEWQVVYYPSDSWGKESIEWFETAYWNTGSEWIVEDNDDRISLYSCEWNEEKMKRDLADQYGVSVEECEFYKFDGYVRQPKYKKI